MGGVSAADEARFRKLCPRHVNFVGVYSAVATPDSAGATARRARNVRVRIGGGDVARRSTITIDKSEISDAGSFQLRGKVMHPRSHDHLLKFQHAAQQNTDDHHNNGNFDQGKSALPL